MDILILLIVGAASFGLGWTLAMRKLGYKIVARDEIVLHITVDSKEALKKLADLKSELEKIRPC